MIIGVVNANYEATIPLTIDGAYGQQKTIFEISSRVSSCVDVRTGGIVPLQNHEVESSNIERQIAMPTVLRSGPYRFFFVSLDRDEPPHIHVRRENMVAKFWLDPVVLQQAGGYSRTELNTIARLVHEHRDMLLERWYEFFGD